MTLNLSERANLIAEMGRQLEDQGDVMFNSERVGLSAKIETAARERNDARTGIIGKVEGWTRSIQDWNVRLGLLTCLATVTGADRVRDKVATGDISNLPLCLSVALASLLQLWLLRRRMGRTS